MDRLSDALRSPWLNLYVERVTASIRRHCIDHFIVLNERHLRRLNPLYLTKYR